MAAAPAVRTHDLDIPRILYLHSWSRTQDEGWVRAALETYGVPFTYMGDKELATMSDLRSKYDVVIYPHVGGSAQSAVAGVPVTGTQPVPYRRTAETPSFGTPDSTSDIRGGMGIEGLMNLYQFVRQGGTLITEGSTSTIFPEYNLTPGVTVETPPALFARGSIMRGLVADSRSPLAYGIGENELPVYFNQGPILNAGGAPGFAAFGGRGGGGTTQNVMANQPVYRSPLGGAGTEVCRTGRWPWQPWRGSRSAGAWEAAGGGGRGGRGGRPLGSGGRRPSARCAAVPTDASQMCSRASLAARRCRAAPSWWTHRWGTDTWSASRSAPTGAGTSARTSSASTPSELERPAGGAAGGAEGGERWTGAGGNALIAAGC